MDVDHGLKMNLSRGEIRAVVLHEFHLDRKAAEPINNTCSTMDEDVLFTRTAQHYGLIDLRVVTWDSTIYLAPVDYCSWTWIS